MRSIAQEHPSRRKFLCSHGFTAMQYRSQTYRKHHVFCPVSRFLSLPFEVQSAVYRYCYPPWSLVLRDHLCTTPLISEFVPTTCSHLRHRSSRSCPDADKNSILPHGTSPNASPGLNLILVCRDVYRVANPILQDSYQGILEVSLADYHLLGNKDLCEDFCRRYESLLSRTHTLDIDVSNTNSFKDSDHIGRSAFTTALPKVQTLVIRDAFMCTDTTSLLARYPGVTHSDKETEPQNADLKALVGKVIEKHVDSTQCMFIALAGHDWFDSKSVEKCPGAFHFVFRMQIEGLTAGIYVSSSLDCVNLPCQC